MGALLGKSRVIHDPGRQRMLARHRGQHLAAHLLQKRVIAPGRVGHDVMQRLVHLAHVAGSQTRGHRLDALALDRQHEALGVVLDGDNAIGMPGGLGQTVQIGLQTLRLAEKSGCWRLMALNVLPHGRQRQKIKTKVPTL
jgi:hypothetical protein